MFVNNYHYLLHKNQLYLYYTTLIKCNFNIHEEIKMKLLWYTDRVLNINIYFENESRNQLLVLQ